MDKNRFFEIRAHSGAEPRVRLFLLHFLKDLLIVGWVGLCVSQIGGGLGALLSAPAIGVIMFRNFSLMHDCVHGATLGSRTLNDVAGVWAGAMAILPFDPWKKVHLLHHTWAGNIEKDPVMMIVKAYPSWPHWLRVSLDVFWKCWIPLVASLQYGVFWLQSAKQTVRGAPSLKMFLSLVFPIALWATIVTFSSPLFLWGSIVPGVAIYLLMAEVVNLPHHLELPQFRGETRLPLWEQHRIARSCIYPDWFARNVVLNFNYHIEHHLYPALPWYRLQEVHQLLKSELGTAYNTDPQFAWILKNRPKSLKEVVRAMEEHENREHDHAA